MDKRLKHGKMSHVLKTDGERHVGQRQAVLSDQWESVESDTESLAQERAYQQQLQMRIGHQNKTDFVLSQTERVDSLQQRDGGDEDETEDLQIYDSLEVAADSRAKKNPTLLHTEYLVTGQLLPDDAYFDLRYDPNWRTNLKGANGFAESPHMSFEEDYQNPQETPRQSCGDREGPAMTGAYRYIVDTSPAPAVTPHTAGDESDHSYHLHPQNDQTRSVTSPCCLSRASLADLLGPFSISTEDESHSRALRQKGENSCDSVGVNVGKPHELTEDIQGVHVQESKTCYQQGGPSQTQQRSTSPLTSPQVSSNRKPRSVTEDIVERNKITLGRTTSKWGSYTKAHAVTQDMPHTVKKVTQISKGRRAQQKEYPNPSRQQQPPAPGVKTGHEDCLSSPLAKPATTTQSKPRKMTSLLPLPPSIHLNIHLSTPSHVLPLLQQTGQDAFIDLASLHGLSHWSSASEVTFSRCRQTNLHTSQDRLNAQPLLQNLESSPEQWQRTTALKWPLSCRGEDQKWSPNEVHTKQLAQHLPRTPTSTLSQGSGSYAVLPPIGKPTTGRGPEPSVNTACPVHRSSSDGYLAQMERQKQMKARVTYKAYGLKDYKQLESDLKLRGLGPDRTAIEKTKTKRQKLYSNVIREQNKRTSRIPFPPTNDPDGNDNKVPRMKALEYAKTITKPPVQPQPKQRQKHQREDLSEHAPHLEGLDVSQLATLELLRKRHEEEKQAVAVFRKVHAV